MPEMAWFIPVLIYLARIVDVSIGTVRMILVIGGNRVPAALLGFVEVIIWVLAVGGVIKFLGHPAALLAYGAGFATGTYVGMRIEDRIALGYRVVRAISTGANSSISTELRLHGFRVTRLEGTGKDGPVEVAFCVVKRRLLAELLRRLREIAPDAFVTVERADRAEGGPFGVELGRERRIWRSVGLVRK